MRNLARWLNDKADEVGRELPAHQRAEIAEAAKTWRGTFRWLMRAWFG